ncbi:MAG: HisA/HisF-related TIM barrel protein [Gemmatimonadaceae bacterium]
MIAIPALDLRDGACVQLVGGDYLAERFRHNDPAAVARQWAHYGFSRLHIVDLDAATGRGSNSELVRELIRATPLEVQAGGGLRDATQIESVFEAGARYAVLGTRALEDVSWLADVAYSKPSSLVVAADVRGRSLVTRGWQRRLRKNVIDIVEELNELPLAGVFVTAVHCEGEMSGTDLALFEDVVDACVHPVCAAGGVASLRDLSALAARGVAAVVIGMALYTGALDPRVVAQEFAA